MQFNATIPTPCPLPTEAVVKTKMGAARTSSCSDVTKKPAETDFTSTRREFVVTPSRRRLLGCIHGGDTYLAEAVDILESSSL
jgi:hypothetical protein